MISALFFPLSLSLFSVYSSCSFTVQRRVTHNNIIILINGNKSFFHQLFEKIFMIFYLRVIKAHFGFIVHGIGKRFRFFISPTVNSLSHDTQWTMGNEATKNERWTVNGNKFSLLFRALRIYSDSIKIWNSIHSPRWQSFH